MSDTSRNDDGDRVGIPYTEQAFRRDLPWAAGLFIALAMYGFYEAEMVLRQFQRGEPLIEVGSMTPYANFVLIAVLVVFVPYLLGMKYRPKASLMPRDVVGLLALIVISVACLKLDILGTRQKYHIYQYDGYVRCLHLPERDSSNRSLIPLDSYFYTSSAELCDTVRKHFSDRIRGGELTRRIHSFEIDYFKRDVLKIDIYKK